MRVRPRLRQRSLRSLTKARDLIFGNLPAQVVVRRGAGLGLLPRALIKRIQPYGPHPVATPAGNTVTYVSDERDILARNVVWPGDWERSSLRLFSELARNAGWVLDVGAYTGIYSLTAVADSERARVIAFEPNPEILPNLHRNLAVNEVNDRVRVIESAIADAPGRVALTVPEDRTAASIAIGMQGDQVDVAVTTLDRSAGERRIDLIKMDIEGAEAAALRGGATLLQRDQPHILVELLTEAAFGEVCRTLAPFGYRTVRHLGPLGPEEVTDFIDQPRHANYHFPRTR